MACMKSFTSYLAEEEVRCVRDTMSQRTGAAASKFKYVPPFCTVTQAADRTNAEPFKSARWASID
eukprot:1389349-Rhodomonas_salina.3